MLQIARVSKSFRNTEMLDDDALSEDYDEDPYFQDFDEEYRWINNSKGLMNDNEMEEEKHEEDKTIEEGANKYGLNLDGSNEQQQQLTIQQ